MVCEKIAKIICVHKGYDSYQLEPGDLPQIDGYCRNGDPGHFLWRQELCLAKKILNAIKEDCLKEHEDCIYFNCDTYSCEIHEDGDD